MQVARLGDDLVVRLPQDVVDALQLREGDEVAVEATGERTLQVARPDTRADGREAALARLLARSRPAPPGFRFSRDEANQRGGA